MKTLNHSEFLELKNRNKTPLDNYQNGFADWLNQYDFKTFATFTTKNELSLAGARRMAEKFARYIQAGEKTSFFWAAEPFDTRIGYHFHGLIDLSGTCTNYSLWYHWTCYKKFGYSRFTPIVRTKEHSTAVEQYCSKYITKNLADYDLYTKGKIYGAPKSGTPENPSIINPFNTKNSIQCDKGQ